MEMDIRSVLLQMRVTHAIQTANLIDQANALFNLEDTLRQKEIEDRNKKKARRKVQADKQHHEFALGV